MFSKPADGSGVGIKKAYLFFLSWEIPKSSSDIRLKLPSPCETLGTVTAEGIQFWPRVTGRAFKW